MWHKWHSEVHWPLVYTTLALVVIGILFIYSATYRVAGNFEMKQIFWVVLGFGVFFAIPFVGYRTFLSVSYLLYAVTVALLLWVLIAGQSRLGAQRWISLGPFVLQPSEFAKLATILAMAHFLGSNNPWERGKKIIFAAIGIGIVPLFLVMRQPDLGSSLLFVPIIAVMIYLWGIRYRTIIMTAIAGLLSAPLFWFFLREYQKKRIMVFLNPQLDPLGAGYTALQSRIAVGAGGVMGKGYLAGTQSQLNFVPEHHTDFIFCVIGEEWGFLGAMVVVLLYGVLFHAIFSVIQHTTDIKAKLLASGIVALLFTQVFINIGMSVGLMPVTGLTLPLVSYGGSSFLATSIALGRVLSIHKDRSIF